MSESTPPPSLPLPPNPPLPPNSEPSEHKPSITSGSIQIPLHGYLAPPVNFDNGGSKNGHGNLKASEDSLDLLKMDAPETAPPEEERVNPADELRKVRVR